MHFVISLFFTSRIRSHSIVLCIHRLLHNPIDIPESCPRKFLLTIPNLSILNSVYVVGSKGRSEATTHTHYVQRRVDLKQNRDEISTGTMENRKDYTHVVLLTIKKYVNYPSSNSRPSRPQNQGTKMPYSGRFLFHCSSNKTLSLP